MRTIINLMFGVVFLLLLTEAIGRAPIQADLTMQHWDMGEHYVHVMTIKADDLSRVIKTLKDYDPYIYGDRIEIRYITKELKKHRDKYFQIRCELRNEFNNR